MHFHLFYFPCNDQTKGTNVKRLINLSRCECNSPRGKSNSSRLVPLTDVHFSAAASFQALWLFMGLKQTADTSCHRLKHIPENAPSKEEKKGALESTALCMSVTQETDACSISRSSRCSFTTNAIHVPRLYDCMSNQKIVLLLHFIRVNKSFNFDIIGPLIAPMCCVSSSFICKKNERLCFM